MSEQHPDLKVLSLFHDIRNPEALVDLASTNLEAFFRRIIAFTRYTLDEYVDLPAETIWWHGEGGKVGVAQTSIKGLLSQIVAPGDWEAPLGAQRGALGLRLLLLD